MKNEKLVIAYSGGLDTSVMVHWLKNKYKFEIIACIVDVGQKDNFQLLSRRAELSGAKKVVVIDAKKEFVEQYVFKALKAGAVYEGKYLLGTSLARPLIAKKVVEVAKLHKAKYLAHGATGKGNDQVRFELAFKYLYPEAKIIAPWREWDLKSRKDELEYAKKHKIPVDVTENKPYSSDENLVHISYEGGKLEDLSTTYDEEMFSMSVGPHKAPDRYKEVEIHFNKGVPEKIFVPEKKEVVTTSVEIIDKLNQLGGECGIGRIDIVENRLVGIKSRGVYESPGMTILYFAHREIETLVLDRETLHYKDKVALDYASLVYYGLWFTPLREALDKFVDETQKYVSGKVKLKLYKGNIIPVFRYSKYSLYEHSLASFDTVGEGLLKYNHKDAEGFINLFSLPYKVESLRNKKFKK